MEETGSGFDEVKDENMFSVTCIVTWLGDRGLHGQRSNSGTFPATASEEREATITRWLLAPCYLFSLPQHSFANGSFDFAAHSSTSRIGSQDAPVLTGTVPHWILYQVLLKQACLPCLFPCDPEVHIWMKRSPALATHTRDWHQQGPLLLR